MRSLRNCRTSRRCGWANVCGDPETGNIYAHGAQGLLLCLDGKTGKLLWRKYVIPAPGEPGSETWKDPAQAAWRTGGGAMWVTGSYDVATDQERVNRTLGTIIRERVTK